SQIIVERQRVLVVPIVPREVRRLGVQCNRLTREMALWIDGSVKLENLALHHIVQAVCQARSEVLHAVLVGAKRAVVHNPNEGAAEAEIVSALEPRLILIELKQVLRPA